MWINRVGRGGVISNLNKCQSVAQQSATIHHFLKLDAISAIYVNDVSLVQFVNLFEIFLLKA